MPLLAVVTKLVSVFPLVKDCMTPITLTIIAPALSKLIELAVVAIEHIRGAITPNANNKKLATNKI